MVQTPQTEASDEHDKQCQFDNIDTLDAAAMHDDSFKGAARPMNSLFKPKKGENSQIESLSEVQAKVHLKIQLLNDELNEVREVIKHLNV